MMYEFSWICLRKTLCRTAHVLLKKETGRTLDTWHGTCSAECSSFRFMGNDETTTVSSWLKREHETRGPRGTSIFQGQTNVQGETGCRPLIADMQADS